MFRSPSRAGLPPLDFMLDDIPASLQQIARHLDISTRTLQNYRRTGAAPRAVALAIFWETRWGRSAADTEAANWGSLHYRSHMIAQRELERMGGHIERLEAELTRAYTQGADMAANAPVWRVV